MPRNRVTHTTVGVELVRKLAAEGNRIFSFKRAEEIAPTVGLSAGYIREAVHHLVKTGWLIRLRKGLYALTSAIPGIASVHEFEIAMALVNPAAISHWSALHYHGLTEQAPRRVFVLTTTGALIPRARSRDKGPSERGYRLGETVYQFVQVKREHYFGMEKVWMGEAQVMVTDPERTLLDGLDSPQYCGDFGEVLHAFQVRSPHLDLDRIISYAQRLNLAIAKRLGWVLESLGVDFSKLDVLAKIRTKGYRVLDSTGPRKGPCNRHWMIQENLPGKIKE